jgi:hypothetical protein
VRVPTGEEEHHAVFGFHGELMPTGWIEDHQFGSSVSIWIGNPLEREVAVASPDANGNFSVSFVISASTRKVSC